MSLRILEGQWKIILCNKIYNAFSSTKVSFQNRSYKKQEWNNILSPKISNMYTANINIKTS